MLNWLHKTRLNVCFFDVFRDFKLLKHLFTLNLTPIPVYHVFIIPLTWFSSTLRSNLLKLIILDHVTYQYQKQQKHKKFPKVVKSCSFCNLLYFFVFWTPTDQTDRRRPILITGKKVSLRSTWLLLLLLLLLLTNSHSRAKNRSNGH